MELQQRNQSVAELKKEKSLLLYGLMGAVGVILLLAIKIVTQSELVLLRTPGLPSDAQIERSTMDKGSQRASLLALTSAITQINPANAEYQKKFIEAYLSPQAFTKISSEMDGRVKALVAQRELGSYYFVFKEYRFDPKADKHYVMGDVHTVNAARDSAESYVFVFKCHVENYRLLVDEVTSYAGDQIHDTAWEESRK